MSLGSRYVYSCEHHLTDVEISFRLKVDSAEN